jgi:hypothetical protein
MDRYALDAASQDEDAAASVGIDVTREKLKVTAISAAMCAVKIYHLQDRVGGKTGVLLGLGRPGPVVLKPSG